MFPFYVYNILSGIEEDGTSCGNIQGPIASILRVTVLSVICVSVCAGTGAVYSFDPVGSYEREACRGAGAAQSLLQPFLDNQVSFVAREGLSLSPLLASQRWGIDGPCARSTTRTRRRRLERNRSFLVDCL